MKRFTQILTFIIIIGFMPRNYSQVGIGTASPNMNSILDIESSDSGILIPRMTQTQKEVITVDATANGLLIYQTDNTPGFYYYNGTSWVTFAGGADNDWTINGNDMYNANSGNVGVGTGITTPAHKLHVQHNQDGAGVMRVQNNTAGGFAGIYFFQNTDYRGHIGYVNTGGASTFGGKGAYQLSAGNRPMIFTTNSGSESFMERVIIAQNGRVGINTNPTNLSTPVQPNSTLQVNGSIAVGVARVNTGSGPSAYTVPSSVSKLILDASGNNTLTVVLPDPATCTGRLISVSRGTGTKEILIDPVGASNIQNLDGTISNITLLPLHTAGGAGINIQFWSDGATWYR